MAFPKLKPPHPAPPSIYGVYRIGGASLGTKKPPLFFFWGVFISIKTEKGGGFFFLNFFEWFFLKICFVFSLNM